MSDLRSEIVSKVLNSWEPTPAQVEEQSIAKKVFNFVNDNPSCTINDIVAGIGIDLGRASATTLALYQRGKLDRKPYPNPDPNGRRGNVFVYWTAVNNYADKGVKRLMPKKEKKAKKIVIKAVDALRLKALQKVVDGEITIPRHEVLPFDPEQFVKGLSLTEVKQLHKFLESYFE